MIRMKKAERTDIEDTKAIYEVISMSVHGPGRHGVIVTHEMRCRTLPGFASVMMDINCESDTVDNAIDKLAAHLELMAKALRVREKTAALPIF